MSRSEWNKGLPMNLPVSERGSVTRSILENWKALRVADPRSEHGLRFRGSTRESVRGILSRVAQRLGMSVQKLSRCTADVRRQFGIRNRLQAHAWNFNGLRRGRTRVGKNGR